MSEWHYSVQLVEQGNPVVFKVCKDGRDVAAFLFGMVYNEGLDRVVPRAQSVSADWHSIRAAKEAFFTDVNISEPRFVH